MTITLNLPPEVARAYSDHAEATGKSLDEAIRLAVIAGQPHLLPRRTE